MNKNLIVAGILLASLTIISVFLVGKDPTKVTRQDVQNEENFSSPEIILFYGDGCPHCVIVEKHIEDNNIDDEIFFERKEIYYNKSNSNQLLEKAKKCDIPTNNIGVPFLWTGETCLLGYQEIIDFFELKMNEQEHEEDI